MYNLATHLSYYTFHLSTKAPISQLAPTSRHVSCTVSAHSDSVYHRFVAAPYKYTETEKPHGEEFFDFELRLPAINQPTPPLLRPAPPPPLLHPLSPPSFSSATPFYSPLPPLPPPPNGIVYTITRETEEERGDRETWPTLNSRSVHPT